MCSFLTVLKILPTFGRFERNCDLDYKIYCGNSVGKNSFKELYDLEKFDLVIKRLPQKC